VSLRVAPIAARVTGVYGTVHTDRGEFDTEGPAYVEIDCELIVFHLPVAEVPFECRMTSFTLHLGTVTQTFQVAPTKLRRGDRMTVAQGIVADELGASDRPPAWTLI
jgi:hypothetical protein